MRGGDLADGGAVTGRLDADTRRLAIVFGLPLIDGVFVSLVLAGMLDTLVGVAVMGVLVFGGTATAAVILASCRGSLRQDVSRLAIIGAVAVPLAGAQAMLAPTIAMLVDTGILERFAAVVLVLLAITIARPSLGDRLPSPWLVIGCGFVASIQPVGDQIVPALSTTLFVHGVAAVLLGLAIAAGVAAAGAKLRRGLDPDRLRLGAGLSLVVVAGSLLTGLPPLAALVVLAGSLVFAVNTDAEQRGASMRTRAPMPPGE